MKGRKKFLPFCMAQKLLDTYIALRYNMIYRSAIYILEYKRFYHGCAYQKSIRANDGDRFLHFTVFTGTQPWLWHCAKGQNYGSLSKMEKDGLISLVREEDKRKIYEITALGREVLETEKKRIDRLYRNMKEM